MTSKAAVVAETPPPPAPARKKIPRPWLDRLRTPLSFKEQKPDVIWEDEDDDASPAIDLLPPPKQLGLLESFQQLWQGFCVPKTSHAPSQHRTTQSAPPVMAIWMDSFGAATTTTAAPFNVSPAAPTVIYIMHSPASSPMTPGHKTTAATTTTTTWHQQYVSSPYNGGVSGAPPTVTPSPPPPSFDESAMKPSLARTSSLPSSNRPPRVNRRSTSGKPPMPPPLRLRSATGDSRASSTSSRHRRSTEIDWTAESLDQIMTGDLDRDDGDDDDSTIQSIEDDEDDCNKQWMMEWAAGAASPRQRRDSDNTFQSLVEPTYLPTCPIMLKDYNRCSILVSGWLAYSPGELAWTKGISRMDIYYMVVLQSERVLYLNAHGKSAGQSSQQERYEASSFTRMELPKDAYVEMKLASRFLGKAILVKSMSSNKTLCTLLPVSLSPSFLKHGTMNLGPAAVAQHDAALHLMFALDSWIRSSRHW